MSVTFLAPAALLGLVVVPLFWWAGSRQSRARALHRGIRSSLALLIVLALAGPVLGTSTSSVALIHLVDVSHSVSTRALESVATQIDTANVDVRPTVSRILAFGGGATSVPDTAELRQLATAESSTLIESVSPEITDLEQALMAARAEIPPGMNGRIVLYSDGRATSGDTRRALERLAAEGVPVFVGRVRARDLGDVWVESVSLPRAAVSGAAAAVDVTLGAQTAADVEVVLKEGNRDIGRRKVTVSRGVTLVSLDVAFDEPGAHVVTAAVVAPEDRLTENNTLAEVVHVAPKPRLLYVHGETADAGAAPAALIQAGFAVTRLAPRDLPTSAADFGRWDVALLSNVSRRELASRAMSALAEWVEERGGGLFFAGGTTVVGESADRSIEGYRRTEMERLLPVTFDRDDEADVALVIVLDRSWSMNGPAMELSKTAAEAAANTLAPSQMLGIVSFANDATWDVPLSRVRDSRAGWHDAIQHILASGPTAIYLGLEEAYRGLTGVRARANHVILLSDGRQGPDDFEGLVKKMAAARITVSSVSLGADADVELLRNIAAWGGGRNYVVQDAKQIPEIFVKEAKSATSKEDDESGERAVVRHGTFFGDAAFAVPPFLSRNVVTRKPRTIELIGTAQGEPLLTFWPVGLGRAAMLAIDLDGRWNPAWMSWRGFGPMLASVARALAPRRQSPIALTVTARERRGETETVALSLEIANDTATAGGAPSLVATSGDARSVVPLVQVSALRYQAEIIVNTSTPVTLVATAGPGVTVSDVLVSDAAAELRFGPPDLDALRAIAEGTAGAVEPSVEQLRAVNQRPVVRRTRLAPWLIGAALLMWPIDVVVRRRYVG